MAQAFLEYSPIAGCHAFQPTPRAGGYEAARCHCHAEDQPARIARERRILNLQYAGPKFLLAAAGSRPQNRRTPTNRLRRRRPPERSQVSRPKTQGRRSQAGDLLKRREPSRQLDDSHSTFGVDSNRKELDGELRLRTYNIKVFLKAGGVILCSPRSSKNTLRRLK